MNEEFKKTNIYKHAVTEFKALGYIPLDQEQEDGPNKCIQENVFELLETFSNQGHSGFSAPFCINIFSKLAMFEPLMPIQCTADEWEDVDDCEMYQNKRCSSVFKNREDGRPYYIDAIAFREEDGSCFTSGDVCGISSRQYIKLPFVPKTFYVDIKSWEVNKDDESIIEPGSGWWLYEIKDESQLDEVFEYYDRFNKEEQ